MLDSPVLASSLQRCAEELEEQLREVQSRIDATQATQQERASRRRDVRDLVTIVSGARERLESMGPEERREVVRLLNVRVTIGPVYRGRPVSAEITMDLDDLGGLASSETGGSPSWGSPCIAPPSKSRKPGLVSRNPRGPGCNSGWRRTPAA